MSALLIGLVLLQTALIAVASPSSASAETRTLKLYFLHTGERDEITFKRNGRYIDSGLKKINRFLRDWRRNEPTKMDPRLLDLIWEVYQETGSKTHIHVISAYRSPATNSLLRKRGRGVAKKSQHTLGKALDFFIPGVRLNTLRNIGLKKGLGGVGYYPKSGSPFVHMDTGRVRHWPRMSRKELVRVFPRGKTLHVPTDGKPLPRYDQAKSEYERKLKGRDRIVVAKADEIKKRPSFFANLLGRGEEEEDAVSTAAAPKPVQTLVGRSIDDQEPQTPEEVLAAMTPQATPVPALAPRQAFAENGTALDLGTPEEDNSIDGASQTFAYAIPEPAPRDAVLLASANAQAPSISNSSASSDVNAAQTAALSPNEIEDLRREVYAILGPQKAKVEKQIPETIQQDTFRSERLVAEANAPRATGAAIYNRLGLAPPASVNSENASARQAIEAQIASLGSQQQTGIAPSRAPIPPEEIDDTTRGLTVTQQDNAQDTQLPSNEAVARRFGLNEQITASVAAPEAEPVQEEPILANIPVPSPANRPVQIASNPANENATAVAAQTSSDRKISRWALAADVSIAQIAQIKPPAYARNIVRERPASVLSEGFTRSIDLPTTQGFSGSSLERLDFTRFN